MFSSRLDASTQIVSRTIGAMTAVPKELLIKPADEQEAERWVETAVDAIGPDFDPTVPAAARTTSFNLSVSDAAAFDTARRQAETMLGAWAREVAYRRADVLLKRTDPSGDSPSRPATQPPPRWWRIDYDDDSGNDQTSHLAYEDGDGVWWEYDARTSALHNSPWLFTDYYHRSRHGDPSFTSLTSKSEILGLIDVGAGRHNDSELAATRADDDQRLDLCEALGSLPDSG